MFLHRYQTNYYESEWVPEDHQRKLWSSCKEVKQDLMLQFSNVGAYPHPCLSFFNQLNYTHNISKSDSEGQIWMWGLGIPGNFCSWIGKQALNCTWLQSHIKMCNSYEPKTKVWRCHITARDSYISLCSEFLTTKSVPGTQFFSSSLMYSFQSFNLLTNRHLDITQLPKLHSNFPTFCKVQF